MTEELVGQLGYVGITLILVLGGLGLPIPEEAPIVLAAVLSKGDKMYGPLAFACCLAGVLAGDFVVYFLGFFYGEKVLSLPLTRKVLTRARETQITGYFHRHGFKILILGRFAVGFRTAAYLTAGILKLPALKLFLTDLFAATLSTALMFGLGWVFASQIQANFDRVKVWMTGAVALTLIVWLLYRYDKARRRAGQAVGPKVLESDDVPLPPDDLHAVHAEPRAHGPRASAAIPDPALANVSEPTSAAGVEPAAEPDPIPASAPAEGSPGSLGIEVGPPPAPVPSQPRR